MVLESPLRAALLDAAALLLPVSCAGCGVPDRALCGDCADALVPAPVRRTLPDGTPVHAGLEYAGIARETIVAFKADRPGLARHLAPALVAAIAAVGARAGPGGARLRGVGPGGAGPPIELCVVPSTRRARRRRGYDPVRLLIARAGFRAAPVFRAARPHPAQKTLSREERAAHLAGVFVPRSLLDGRRLALVDDVITTGATLAAAAGALRAAGGEVVACAVVASTARRAG